MKLYEPVELGETIKAGYQFKRRGENTWVSLDQSSIDSFVAITKKPIVYDALDRLCRKPLKEFE